MGASPRPDPLILLSFDVEEFDIVMERGNAIPVDEQFEVGRRGLEVVLELLDRAPARPKATLFTTAVFAERYAGLTRHAAERHEIASHGYSHAPELKAGDLERSKKSLEDVCGVPVVGFRRARMAPTDPRAIAAAGYTYNSSEHPVWLPGRYNNFFKPRLAYIPAEAPTLVNIPVSATPVVRIPLFWLAFKNFPAWVNRLLARWTLGADGAVNFYWHPWEFCDIGGYGLPRLDRAVDGARLLKRLEDHIACLTDRGRFGTFAEYAERVRNSLGPAGGN